MSKAEIYKSEVLDEFSLSITSEEVFKTEKKMLLAARIDDAIKAKGWKSKHLAEALDKSPSEISKWLSGTHNFTTDTLWDIERILNVDLIIVEDKSVEQIDTYVVSLKTEGDSAWGIFHDDQFQFQYLNDSGFAGYLAIKEPSGLILSRKPELKG